MADSFDQISVCFTSDATYVAGKEFPLEQFTTESIQYTGKNDSMREYLEIVERSKQLLALLEKGHGAFVCDA